MDELINKYILSLSDLLTSIVSKTISNEICVKRISKEVKQIKQCLIFVQVVHIIVLANLICLLSR